MQTHQDGSVTLSRQELKELQGAYQRPYDILVRQPACLQDYMTQEQYRAVGRWHDQLQGKIFVVSHWIDE